MSTTTAKAGDRLIVSAHRVGTTERTAEIVEVLGTGDRPRYRVRWNDGREGIVAPGSDVTIEKVRRRAKRKADSKG